MEYIRDSGGTYLAAFRWLRLNAPGVGGVGSIPGWGIRSHNLCGRGQKVFTKRTNRVKEIFPEKVTLKVNLERKLREGRWGEPSRQKE